MSDHSQWSPGLTDLSDKPFRLRHPPRRRRLLRRLTESFRKTAFGIWRLAVTVRTSWTDARERRAGAEARLLRRFDGASLQQGRSIAIYAHFSPFSGISEMVALQLQHYARLGFRIIFVSASPRFDEADFARIQDSVELALHRRNFGLDFGSWADALALFPDLAAQAEEMLLVNDSILGPLYPLDGPVARMREGGEGLFGMTDSMQHAPHLQSYFLLARGHAAIADMAAFLGKKGLSARKRLVVKRFEIALSPYMRDRGHRVAALWNYDDLEDELLRSQADAAALSAALPAARLQATDLAGQFNLRRRLLDLPLNPMHHFAGLLVRRCGFPFLKTELVQKNPERILDAIHWRALVPEHAPVPVSVIEDHLASNERPLRYRARRSIPPPPTAPQVAPQAPTPEPDAPDTPDHPWRLPLKAAWARAAATAMPAVQTSTLNAFDLLERVARAPVIVSASHDDYAQHCGGVQNVIHAEQQAFAAEGIGYLHFAPARPSQGLVEVDPAAAFSVRLDGTHLGTASLSALLATLRGLAQRKGVLASVVHHVAGHAPEQLAGLHAASGARQVLFWLHDFGTLCPNPMLLRNDIAFCGGPPEDCAACAICAYGPGRARHLRRLNAFFDAVRPAFLAPSQAALAFWQARAGWPAEDVAVVPPLRLEPLKETPSIHPAHGRLRIAHLGVRASHKGWLTFAGLAERLAGDSRYEFLQLGLDLGHPLPPHVGHIPVKVSPGRVTAMCDAIAAAQIDVVINWSLCFETFSMTAHEAIAAGAFLITQEQAGNIPVLIAQQAPSQGLSLPDADELHALFAGEGLRTALAAARCRRHRLVTGGASAQWLMAERATAHKRSLGGNA